MKPDSPFFAREMNADALGAFGGGWPPNQRTFSPRICRWVAIFCGLLAVSTSLAAAEISHYATRNWLREDGLPQNSVTAVVQTQDGYIWLATYNGLARFDGFRFTVFDSNNHPELHNNRITSLFEAADGALWIGHENGELTRYQNGRFSAVNYRPLKSGVKICGLGADAAGDIWLFNDRGLLERVRDGREVDPPGGVLNQLVSFDCAPAGALWMGREGRVSVFERDQLRTFSFGSGRTNSFAGGMGLSRDGGIWVSCNGCYQKWKDGHWVGSPVPTPWGEDPLTDLIETRNGLLVAATSDRGLYVLTQDGSGDPSHFSRTNGFPSDWIVSLMEDREGNIWVATGSAGLVRLRHSVIDRVNPPDQWQGRAVQSVTISGDGSIWAGTGGAGIYRLRAGVWRHFNISDGLTNGYIWSVAEDQGGRLWAGTWGGGLYLNQGDRFQLAPGFDHIAPPITAIFCESPERLWLGTAQGLLCDQAGAKQLYAQEQAVRTVLPDHAGAIWFGLSGGGLACLKDGVIRHFDKTSGLGSDFVQCLRMDASGAVWIGTFGGGLSRWKDGRMATIGTRQGLGDNVICDMEEDDRGYLWMSSFNGLLRASKRSLNTCADGLTNIIHCDTYGISDGMPTLECSGGSQPSGCRSADGLIWFATSRGLVSVHPREVGQNALPPPVVIEKMTVDSRVSDEPPAADGRLKIPPGRHRLEFQYTGLSFAAPEKVCFQHLLEGLDSSWIDTGPQRAAEYDYLPPGNYTFRVIACNNDGVWSPQGASLALTILPYFWQTSWFRFWGMAVLLTLAGGSSWYGTRRRMTHKLERLERQRALERERTRIARDIHDDLGASLTRINLLSQSARLGLGDVPQHLMQLDQIATTARQLTRALDEIVWAVDPQHDTLDSLASYLAMLVHDLFHDAGIRCRLDFPPRLPVRPVTAEFRHNLFLAFKEALHNVLKHSHATEVGISLALEATVLRIIIRDNGTGFDPAQKDSSGRRHNGLTNMQNRLAEIEGSYEVQTAAGLGTCVTFVLPLKASAK